MTTRGDLVSPIRLGILTLEPHTQASSGGGELFAGSFDWHSCVHAHWALLGIARLGADAELEAFLRARLTDDALEAERAYLAAEREFELPYGRAWLLLLLSELSRRGRKFERLFSETEAAVLGWLEATPFPDGLNEPRRRQIDRPVRGDHYSWLFAWCLTALAGAGGGRLARLRSEKLEPARAEIERSPQTEHDFLHLRSLLALADRLAGRVSAWSYEPVAPFGEITPENAHAPGAAVSRLWPLAWDAGAGDPRAGALLSEALADLRTRPAEWRGDFHCVSHWVPQFLWLALWLAEGRR
jgi:hypothetical protein